MNVHHLAKRMLLLVKRCNINSELSSVTLTPNFDFLSNKVKSVSRKSVNDTNLKTSDIFQDYQQHAIHRHWTEVQNEGAANKLPEGKKFTKLDEN